MSGERKRWTPAARVAAVVAVVPTVLSASGMVRVGMSALGLPVVAAAGLATFLEGGLVASALLARESVARRGSAGADGAAVWVLSAVSGCLSALDELLVDGRWHATASGELAGLVRVIAPLVAAWLWERVMVADRAAGVDHDEAARRRAGLRAALAALRVRRAQDAGRAAGRSLRALDRAHRRALRTGVSGEELAEWSAAVGAVDTVPAATRVVPPAAEATPAAPAVEAVPVPAAVEAGPEVIEEAPAQVEARPAGAPEEGAPAVERVPQRPARKHVGGQGLEKLAAQARRLRDRGVPVEDIAERVGRAPRTVRRWLEDVATAVPEVGAAVAIPGQMAIGVATDGGHDMATDMATDGHVGGQDMATTAVTGGHVGGREMATDMATTVAAGGHVGGQEMATDVDMAAAMTAVTDGHGVAVPVALVAVA